MRWLPIGLEEQDDGEAIRLPCPLTDLIRLVNVGPDRESALRLHQVLRRNPSLMLFALDQYQQDRREPPDSARQLVAWVQSNLNGAVGYLGVHLESGRFETCSEKRFKNSFENFLRARGNRRLRLSLERFLQRVCRLKKSASQSNVARLVGKKLRADQFKCNKRWQKNQCARASREWFSRIGEDIDVAGLFEMAKSKRETTARFAARLQEEKLASMKQLAYGASHEINNPLANIATRSQTMLAKETDPEKRHKLSVIYEQAMRAHEMISDMMLFAHPPALHPASVSVRLLMARIVHEMKPVFEIVPGMDLKILIGPGIDHVELDPTQFAVAIKKLLQNSVEALRSVETRHPKIEVRIDHTEMSELQVSIWDNGSGITDEVARHLFDPFYSGREAGRGLGFGLSKAWTIAKLHGGSLRYDEGGKTGTHFVLNLPLKSSPMASPSASVLTICQNDHENESDAEEEAA